MIRGYTGARDIRGLSSGPVVDVLEAEERADTYVTGGARGLDAFLGSWNHRRWPRSQHVVIIPANKSQVDTWWDGRNDPYDTIKLIYMPDGTTYKDRNIEIVRWSDELSGFPEYAEHDPRSLRSGTWQTIRLARKKPIPVSFTILRG